jgi:hypothetical protein
MLVGIVPGTSSANVVIAYPLFSTFLGIIFSELLFQLIRDFYFFSAFCKLIPYLFK